MSTGNNYGNKAVQSLEDAKLETSSRAKFLSKLNDDCLQANEALLQIQEIVCNILSSYDDWRQWQYEISNTLSDEYYPESAVILLRSCLNLISSNAEEASIYDLAKSLLSSLIKFSDINSHFKRAVVESSAIYEILDFLSRQEGNVKKRSLQIDLIILCFRLPFVLGFNLVPVFEAVEEACVHTDVLKILPAYSEVEDNECQCLVFLWLSRLMAKNEALGADFDGIKIFNVLTSSLASLIERNDKELIFWLIRGISTFIKFFGGVESVYEAAIKQSLLQVLQKSSCYESSCLEKAKQLLSKLSPSESDGQYLKSADFKTNDELGTPELVRDENVLRIEFLTKIFETNADGIVCLDSANAFSLLMQSRYSYKHPTEEWRTAFETVLVQKKFAEIALKYMRVLMTCDLDTEDLTYEILQTILNILWNLCDASREMRISVAEAGIVDFILDQLSDVEEVTKKCVNSGRLYFAFVSAPLSILYNVSRTSQVQRVFLERDAAKILVPYLDDAKYRKVVQVSLCIAYVVSDTPESAQLADEKGIIKTITTMANEAMQSSERRASTSVGVIWSLSELLDGLRLLAKSDYNKAKLMENGIVDLASNLILNGELSEKKNGIDLLWTLCFDAAIRNQIMSHQNDAVINALEELSQQSEDTGLQAIANEVLCFVRKYASIEEEVKLKEDTTISKVPSAEEGHIFLSYSWKQQETVLLIRNELMRRNFTVWMDVDEMHGGLLDAMAKAVEDAAVVLLCFSQSYKQSNPCRAEAHYAYSLGKKIVPVNMEFGYQADGWLGMLVRPLLYVDMSLVQKPFEASMDSLLREIRSILGSPERSPPKLTDAKTDNEVEPPRIHGSIVCSHPSPPLYAGPSPSASPTKPRYAEWSSQEFAKWLQKENLHFVFGKKLECFDGQKIRTFLKIKDQAPEFYYQTLKEYVAVNLPDLLDLITALDRLETDG